MQSKLGSLLESATNILIGFSINTTTQIVVFPWFGINIPLSENLKIAMIFLVISLARSYVIRRLFNRWRLFYA